jgi:hypothetical protein
MKKLVFIGTVVTVAVSLVAVQAASAKSTAISEQQALLLRSEHGIGVPQLTLERGSSERFAVDNPELYGGPIPQDGIVAVTLERGLNERFASDNPVKQDLLGSDSTPSPSPSVESPDFQWGDAGIGAGVLLGAMALLGTCVVAFRHRGHLRTS